MKQLFILISLLIISQPLFAEKIIIKIGQPKIIPISAQQKLSINGQKFIRWVDKGSRLKIIGISEGLAHIKSFSKNYEVQVLSHKKYNIYERYQVLLKSLKGLEISFKNNTPVINGNLYRFSDWKKINKVATKYQIPYLMNAKIDLDVMEQAKIEFSHLLFSYSELMPQLKLLPHPTVYRLKKLSSDDFDHIFKLKGFNIKEHKHSNISKQIKLKLKFIEISNSNDSNFGLTWTGAFQAQVYKKFIDNSKFEAFLNHAASNGDVNIHYQTQLICEINRECQFKEGGQFPVKTSGYINSSVIWKDYGLSMVFTPNLLSGERIKIKLKYEISHLDSQGDGEIPAIKTKSIMTYVNTKNNSPIVVTGLESSMARSNQHGPSPFQQIPLLNKILATNSNKVSATKMILVVTPVLLSGDQ